MSAARVVEVVTTFPDEAGARGCAERLVERGLAACVHVDGPLLAVYRWEGVVAEGEEIAVLLKTRSDMTVRVTERIKELHSYALPCVIGLPIDGGNPDFIGWLNSEVG